MKVINPATEEVITEIQTDSAEDIAKKFSLAKTGQQKWKKVSLSERISIIKKFGDLLLENQDELAIELSKETGKPLSESKGEIAASAGKAQFFINESESILKQEKVNDDGLTEEYLSYDPLGVIANISAWNYPYLVGINIFVPALITGNSVLYKPSEFAITIGKSIESLMHKAGVPKDVFIGVFGDAKAGAALLELPLDGYFFTGSYKTGKLIATSVAHKLVPIGLELGGKDPLYITEEVDNIAASAANAAEGAFYNNGQSCCSVERIYVHENIYDEFVSSFVESVRSYNVGNPMEATTTHGAITRSAHLDFLDDQLSDALSKGAKLLIGGARTEGKGNFFKPTVLTNVNHEMEVMKEETFGPLIGIMKVTSDEEAIKLMNDTTYGLTSAVFTTNVERGQTILKEINSGTGYLNCCDRVSGYLPWSGRGMSGAGSTLSKHGLYAFTNPKGLHLRGLK